ncbi:Membrane glycoprotein [Shigella dysenteriae 1617]|uniref:Membrane glycoprotein n=1 Tax=Shigella dysenteriae 1617 TaxID=754093 RepID=A0A0A6ZNH6_SHIDY|nr:Membrane glycoprotein [Shigella dysenteriae 1617]
MPATDLSALRDGDATVQASVSTINGNTASATHAYSVDATAPTLAINTIATDDILNAAEAGNPLTISGSSTAEAGQTVTVTLNGVTYSGDGDATVQASVSTINGNTASATHAYSVDATAPTLAINTIATDDILNAAEAGNPLTISGSSTAEAGQTVTVTLNGVTYSGTVQADGSWRR